MLFGTVEDTIRALKIYCVSQFIYHTPSLCLENANMTLTVNLGRKIETFLNWFFH